MRLTPDQIARIKACQGVYSVGDTARHIGCSKSSVHDIWAGVRHTNVQAAEDAGYVRTSRVPPEIVQEDGQTLLQRGMSVKDAAKALNVSPTTFYKYVGGSTCLLYVG